MSRPTLVAIPPALVVASLFGLSETQALVVLFIVLPVLLAAVVFPFVAWRSSKEGPAPVRTSEILAHGLLAEAEIVSVRQLGGPLDVRPMLRFLLKVRAAGGEPFDLEVVQSLPRGAIRGFRTGDPVELRITPDRTAGAVVWDGSQP